MTIKKKLIYIFMLVTALFLLSACGLDVVNEVEVNRDFAGTRTITLTADQSTLSNINGGSEALSEFLVNEIGDPLSVEITEHTQSKLVAKLSLSFDSIDDYRQKLTQLAGDSNEGLTINYSYPRDNPFMKGINFEDNSQASIILNFMVNRAIESGLITESYREEIWDSEIFSLVVDGDTLIDQSSNPPWSVDNVSYHGPKDIFMSTSPNSDGNWDRVFFISFDNNSSPIENWKQELFKDYEYEELEMIETQISDYSANIYKFIFRSFTSEALAKVTAQVLGTDSIDLLLKLSLDSDAFDIKYEINEKVGDFPLSSNMDLNSIYHNSFMRASEHDISNFTSLNENVIKASKDQLIEGFVHTLSIKPRYGKVDIKTEIGLDKSLKRTMTIGRSQETLAKNYNDLMTKYLNDNQIQYADNGESFIITYGGENFATHNELFFTSNPNITVQADSIFTYSYTYNDDTSFKLFEFDEISQEVLGPGNANFDTIVDTANSGQIKNEVIISGNKTPNIVVFSIVAILILGVIVGLIILMVKNKSPEKIIPQVETQPKRESYKRQHKFEDTAPIPKITDEDQNLTKK